MTETEYTVPGELSIEKVLHVGEDDTRLYLKNSDKVDVVRIRTNFVSGYVRVEFWGVSKKAWIRIGVRNTKNVQEEINKFLS